MNISIINHIQPTTSQPMKRKYYPTLENTTNNHFDISPEAVELTKEIPISQRLVSCFVTSPIDGADNNGDLLRLGELLNARSPHVEALRTEPSFIEKKRIEDDLPIFTPCCVLRYDFTARKYYPINYTCILDFDIMKDDNPTIDFEELRRDLSALPQTYYCGLATNGIDLFCIVPISAPQRYEEHAAALVRLFRQQGVNIRIAEEVTHARKISTDPSGYFNENPKEFTMFC